MDSSGNEGAWYRSLGGVALLGVDLLLVVALVVGTTSFAGQALAAVGAPAWTSPVTVPWHVYLFATVGATGFVFTMLVRDLDRSADTLARYNLRLPAALPLAAGVYLLSTRLVGDGAPQLLAALAFSAGLLVNTAYHRIRDLSVRLLSPERRGGTASGSSSDDGSSDGSSDDGSSESGSADRTAAEPGGGTTGG